MAAKVDKEALKKNIFWIALGGFFVLWLVALLSVLVSGDQSKEKAWKDAVSGIDAASKSPKNQSFYEPWDKYGEAASSHKDKVWEAGWQQQKDIYTWPVGMEVLLKYPTDSFGTTPRDDLDRRSKFRDDYLTQFVGLDSVINPAVFSGGFDKVFPKQVWDRFRAPAREEIWLAQEDFWVRREMLNIVVEAMNGVALFKDVTAEVLKDNPKLPDGVLARRVYRNANWEMDLHFIKADKGTEWVVGPDSTIKNVNRTHKLQHLASISHPAGVPFRFYQLNGGTCIVRVAGEPLAYEQSAKLGRTYSLNPLSVQKALTAGSVQPLGVQQVLEWETSPIRQLDALELSLHSHRTVTWGLKINEELKKVDPDPTQEGGETSGGAAGSPMGGGPGPAGPGMGGPGPGGSGEGGPGMGGPGGGAASADATKINLISRLRYMHVTKQCRHLPIALRLVVDQSHIHDVLGAVANSPLRIQITQVAFSYAPTPLRPTSGSSGTEVPMGGTPMGSGPGVPPMPGGPGPGRPGMAFGGSSFGRGGSFPGGAGFRSGDNVAGEGGIGGIGGPGGVVRPGETVSQVQDNAKMVELTVYGIATLYERYPAAPPVPAATETPKQ